MRRLPEELLELIISNVNSASSLANLACSSKQFNRITTPRLYHHIHVKFDSEAPETAKTRIRNLTTLLLDNPCLARMVVSLTAGACLDTSTSPINVLYAGETSSAAEHAPVTARWKPTQKKERPDILIRDLLQAMPNILSLDLKVSGRTMTSSCSSLLLQTHSLVNVCIDTIDTSAAQIAPDALLQLENLKNLKLASILFLGPGEDSDTPDQDIMRSILDRLPPNLAQLGVLRSYHRLHCTTAAIFMCINLSRHATPCLQGIDMEGCFANPRFYFKMATYVKIAEMQGIVLRVIENADISFPGRNLERDGDEKSWGWEANDQGPAPGVEGNRRWLLDLEMFNSDKDLE